MKKLLLIIMCLTLATPAWPALTLNPTVPKTTDRWLDVTLDGSTAFDLGFARTINYVLYVPASAGNSVQIRAGAAAAPRVGYAKSIDGGPQIIYITGSVRAYVVGNQSTTGDILLFSFK